MATSLVVSKWTPINPKRLQLAERREELVRKIDAIDEAIRLLDSNPDIGRLADALAEGMKQDY